MIQAKLYPSFFYLAQYYLDTVTDSQPNIFKIIIWVDTDLKLNNFNVIDNSKTSMEKKLCSFIILTLELDKKEKAEFQFTLNTLLYENDFNNFTQKLLENSHRKKVNISEGYINKPDDKLWSIIEHVKAKILLNIENNKSLNENLKKTYVKDKKYILSALEKLNHIDFNNHVEKLEKLEEGKGLSVPLVMNGYTNFVPFNFSSEKVLSKIKMSLNLDKILKVKPIIESKFKI